jgi:protocatechuate 3,4-dioxygenase beta subunit
MSSERSFRPTRRETVLGGLGAGGAWLAARGTGLLGAPPEAGAASCLLTKEVTEGPYWIANSLTRRDIRAGRTGTGLLLYLTVQNAHTCKVIRNADVEIWHADAQGVYSGYSGNTPPSGGGGHATPNNSLRFLRGHQRTNASGVAIFQSVYPGWYRGRTPHIHVKVHVGGNVVHTGQLFFPDTVSAAVYKGSRYYKAWSSSEVHNTGDGIYRQAGSGKAQLKLTRRSGGRGYLGRITMGVAP